jgi:hypothetical protein
MAYEHKTTTKKSWFVELGAALGPRHAPHAGVIAPLRSQSLPAWRYFPPTRGRLRVGCGRLAGACVGNFLELFHKDVCVVEVLQVHETGELDVQFRYSLLDWVQRYGHFVLFVSFKTPTSLKSN